MSLCCVFLCVLAENRQSDKPIIDIQYAEPHILGAASRSDRHPGLNSPIIVYYPSIPIASEDECYDHDIRGNFEYYHLFITNSIIAININKNVNVRLSLFEDM